MTGSYENANGLMLYRQQSAIDAIVCSRFIYVMTEAYVKLKLEMHCIMKYKTITHAFT